MGKPDYDYCGVSQVCTRHAKHPGHHGGFRFPYVVPAKRQPAHAATLLTPRQYELVQRIALGQLRTSILLDMKIKLHTYHHHRQNALQRYDVGTMVELLSALGWLVVPEQETA